MAFLEDYHKKVVEQAGERRVVMKSLLLAQVHAEGGSLDHLLIFQSSKMQIFTWIWDYAGTIWQEAERCWGSNISSCAGEGCGCRISWSPWGGEAVLGASKGSALLVRPWSLSNCRYYFGLCGTISKITTNRVYFLLLFSGAPSRVYQGLFWFLPPETCWWHVSQMFFPTRGRLTWQHVSAQACLPQQPPSHSHYSLTHW